MNGEEAILLSHRSATDYCQPDLAGSGTRDVVEYIYDEGAKVDIRKSDWKSLTDSLTNVLSLFTYLRDEATKKLRKYDENEALGEFLETVLSEENLSENRRFSLQDDHIPDMEELRSAVNQMGIEEFRAYADEQVQCCMEGQKRLDLILNEKYERGGQSAGLFAAAIKSNFDDNDAELLITAYIWSADVNGCLLTRHGSPIYSKKDSVQESLRHSRFQIISPQDVVPHLP